MDVKAQYKLKMTRKWTILCPEADYPRTSYLIPSSIPSSNPVWYSLWHEAAVNLSQQHLFSICYGVGMNNTQPLSWWSSLCIFWNLQPPEPSTCSTTDLIAGFCSNHFKTLIMLTETGVRPRGNRRWVQYQLERIYVTMTSEKKWRK